MSSAPLGRSEQVKDNWIEDYVINMLTIKDSPSGNYKYKIARVLAISLKANIGFTVLVLPSYYKQTGWLVGILSLLAIAIVISISALIFASVAKTFQSQTEWETLSKLLGNYASKHIPGMGKYGQVIETFTTIVLLCNQIALCSAYGHLGAIHLYKHIAGTDTAPEATTASNNPAALFTLSIFIVLAIHFSILLFMNDYEKQAMVSILSMVLCLCALALVTYSVCSQFHVDQTVRAARYSKMILFSLTGYIFAFESLTLIVPILKTAPDVDSGARYFILAIVVCFALYSFVGTTVYMKLGESVQVIFFHSMKDVFSSVASHIYIVSVQLGFGIQYLVGHEILESLFFKKNAPSPPADDNGVDKSKWPGKFFPLKMLCVFVLIFFIITLTPHIDAMLSIFGALFGVYFTFHIPLILYMARVFAAAKKNGYTWRTYSKLAVTGALVLMSLGITGVSLVGSVERAMEKF